MELPNITLRPKSKLCLLPTGRRGGKEDKERRKVEEGEREGEETDEVFADDDEGTT